MKFTTNFIKLTKLKEINKKSSEIHKISWNYKSHDMTRHVMECHWINYFVLFPSSSRSPRSFPSPSLCQKFTASSKSSSTPAWNTLRTSTSGTSRPLTLLFYFILSFCLLPQFNTRIIILNTSANSNQSGNSTLVVGICPRAP